MGKDRGREFSDGLPSIDRLMAVAYALIFVMVPIVTFFVGQWLDRLLLFPAFPPLPFNLIVGLAVLLFGLAVGIKSTRLLYLIGRGLPWGEAEGEARSTKLVTTGLYASCRNPMTLGYSLLPCGMGIMFRSLSMTFIVPSVVFSVMIVWLKVWEEPRLERRFGEAYREYQRRTPFLIPNFRLLLMDLAGSAPRLCERALKRPGAERGEEPERLGEKGISGKLRTNKLVVLSVYAVVMSLFVVGSFVVGLPVLLLISVYAFTVSTLAWLFDHWVLNSLSMPLTLTYTVVLVQDLADLNFLFAVFHLPIVLSCYSIVRRRNSSLVLMLIASGLYALWIYAIKTFVYFPYYGSVFFVSGDLFQVLIVLIVGVGTSFFVSWRNVARKGKSLAH